MPKRETMLKMYSLWYDHSNVKNFHVMENYEEKLCCCLKIGATTILLLVV